MSTGSETPNRNLMDLVVDDVCDETSSVRSLSLVSASGAALPSHTPGSNLPVRWRRGRFNSYSLTGEGFEPLSYTVSVRLDPEGEGGSRWMHGLSKGDHIVALPPRDDFTPVWIARKHLLLAGGIGVTPILSHARSHHRWGRPFEVHYVAREPAHVEELQALGSLATYSNRGDFVDALLPLLRRQPMGTHLYVCGPQSMIDGVLDAARAAFWPPVRLHAEAFEIADLEPGSPFTITADRSQVTLEVPAGVSALDALEQAGVPVPSLCRRGFCGECRTTVLAGDLVHRDEVLDEDDRARGDQMMVCVSRAVGDVKLAI